jgi:photosystem II stability/assembly factor-like uncharacterized protein
MDYGYIQGVDLEAHVVFQTSDGGATWRRVGTGGTLMSFVLAFRTTRTIVLSDGDSLFSTTSGWEHLSAATIDGRSEVGFVTAVSFLSTQSWIVGIRSDDVEFLATHNGGQSWQSGRRTLPSPGAGRAYTNVEPVAFLDPETWLAAAESCTTASVCSARLMRTRDRGHTWQHLGRLPNGASSGRITFVDRFHAWAETDGDGGGLMRDLYATDDGGWSWHVLTP